MRDNIKRIMTPRVPENSNKWGASHGISGPLCWGHSRITNLTLEEGVQERAVLVKNKLPKKQKFGREEKREEGKL